MVPKPASMETAPSSLFALVLESHRLLFVREQSDSPSIGQFGSTARSFIRSTHMGYINGLHEEARNSEGKKPTKKALLKQLPIPDVEVVAIFSSESLTAFVNRYKELQVMRVSLAETNNEIDNAEFFKQFCTFREPGYVRRPMP